MSKSFRLIEIAEGVIKRERGFEVERLDLDRQTSEFGSQIHPCKGCFSTGDAALPLALLLLSQPFAGPDPRLDERDLSDVGGGPRCHDRDTGPLVSGPTLLKL